MSKKIPEYQGFHTHPSQDSSSEMEDDGTIMLKHRVDLRQGYMLTALKELGHAKVSELVEQLEKTFPKSGYNVNHVSHALKRLRRDFGLVEVTGVYWSLTMSANVAIAKFKAAKKNVRK